MHVTTEVEHPQHVCEVGGVGLTETVHDVVEALCRINLQGSTKDIADEAHARDRQEARRELQRLEEAGVVVSREMNVNLAGTARKPIEWRVTQDALDAGIIERLRAGSEVPLDPVREREQRIADLEDAVEQLRREVDHLQTEYEILLTDSESQPTEGWGNIDPADTSTSSGGGS